MARISLKDFVKVRCDRIIQLSLCGDFCIDEEVVELQAGNSRIIQHRRDRHWLDLAIWETDCAAVVRHDGGARTTVIVVRFLAEELMKSFPGRVNFDSLQGPAD